MMTPAVRSKPGLFIAVVEEHTRICREHFRVTLALRDFPAASPGQFVHILCRAPDRLNDNDPSVVAGEVESHEAAWRAAASTSPGLRRPFSIGGLRRNQDRCEIDLIGRVIGSGTAWLDALAPGDCVDLLGPLGRCFTLPATGQTALLIAGGVGLPPILWLNEILAASGIDRIAFFGAQARDLIPLRFTSEPDASGKPTACVEEFARFGTSCAITTDDGSCGLAGRITHALMQHLGCAADPDKLVAYACGPEPMLEAVASICAARGIECELAMERVMGCGLGTCQSCVLPVRDAAHDDGWRYALCCTEGPVFDARRILFKPHG